MEVCGILKITLKFYVDLLRNKQMVKEESETLSQHFMSLLVQVSTLYENIKCHKLHLICMIVKGTYVRSIKKNAIQ